MVSAVSKSDICNLALDYLLQSNEKTVTNIEAPVTSTEVICARWYDVTRKSLLRKHPWHFATKRAVLTPDATAPLFGFDNAYNLPNDFVRLVSIEDPDTGIEILNSQYQIENNQILTGRLLGSSSSTNGVQSLNIRYVYDFTDVSRMDTTFIDVFAMDLALRISYKFTSSNPDVKRIERLLTNALQAARSINGQERPPTRIERSRVRAVRRRLGSNQRSGIFFE